jgi:hypothetical protein
MRTKLIATVTAGAAIAATLVVMLGGNANAGIDPADFNTPVHNPYFPLKPGTVFVYRGTEGNDHLIEHLRITGQHRMVEGVSTVVVRDILHANGRLAEKTTDWYADDNAGNTWYFGERTATYKPDGTVESREGAWMAGVNGGVAGVIMPANPEPTDAYRQESLKGHAEDQAWIVANHETLWVPYGTVDQVVRSYEWTRLEPSVVSAKFYAPGLGIVSESDIAGGTEDLSLVDVRHT